MYPNTLRIVAATIAVLLLNTAAEAKKYQHRIINNAPIITCNRWGCSDYARHATQEPQTRPRRAYGANGNRAMRIDKPRQYIKPRYPTDKLITRESYKITSGIVRSAKTGATAHVSPQYVRLFQAYIDDLEANGAAIYYMGGYRRGPCSMRSMHPCGKALDICQDARDRVSGHKNCHLPGRQELARIAARHGLFEGGQWCDGDMGHAQVGISAAACGTNFYSAVSKFKTRQHIQYAVRR